MPAPRSRATAHHLTLDAPLVPVTIRSFEPLTVEESQTLRHQKAGKGNPAMVALVDEVARGQPIRILFVEDQGARGLRTAISRAATTRGLKVETLEGHGFVAVMKVDEPRRRQALSGPAQRRRRPPRKHREQDAEEIALLQVWRQARARFCYPPARVKRLPCTLGEPAVTALVTGSRRHPDTVFKSRPSLCSALVENAFPRGGTITFPNLQSPQTPLRIRDTGAGNGQIGGTVPEPRTHHLLPVSPWSAKPICGYWIGSTRLIMRRREPSTNFAARHHRASAKLLDGSAHGTGHHNSPGIEIGREGNNSAIQHQSAVNRHPTQDRPTRRRAVGVAAPPPHPTHVATLQGLPARCLSQRPIREQTRGPRHPWGGRDKIGADPAGTRSLHQMACGSISTASTLCSFPSFLSFSGAIVAVAVWPSARKRRARSA